ncbi:MAG: putative molybdenum carrier protein [Proteobacteria bacterium]|nr:putative molybdenum carrier protein [Pseudomonadota bacterium]
MNSVRGQIVTKIVSGGQTGVDRAALDWAVQQGIPHGGWCPKGRIAEDGAIDSRYELQETNSAKYPQRTKQNIIDSDGTLILNSGELDGGSLETRESKRPGIYGLALAFLDQMVTQHA